MVKGLFRFALVFISLALLVLMFFGKDSHTSVGELAGIGAVIAVSLSFNRAEVRGFVRSRKREIYVGSGALIAAAIVVSIWDFAPITISNIAFEPSDLSSLLIVLGVVIAIMPSTAGVIERSQLASENELVSKSAPKTFDGVAEAVGAVRFVLNNLKAFSIISGAWLIVMAVVPVIGLYYMAHMSGASREVTRNSATLVLLGIFLSSLSLPLFMSAWQKYVLFGSYPRFGVALPDGSYWGYLWRWWIFSSLVSSFHKQVRPQAVYVAGLMHVADVKIIEKSFGVIIWLIALLAMSRFIFNLPALAIRDHEKTGKLPPRSYGKLGIEFTMGLIVAAIVYPLADILPADTAATGFEGIFFREALPSLLSSLMMFGGLAFVSTYVCWAYIEVQPTSVPANLTPVGHNGAI